MSVVSKPRRLVPVAAPAGIVCLGGAVVLAGLGTTVAPLVAAGMLVIAGLWCLGAGWGER